jgi:LDH2 family malate/lactate/ureidoglycolate dehydrogenase
MKVSFNELQGLGRKAFEGLGFDEGDAADAADMVAWMEAHGLHGLLALKNSLDYLLSEDKQPPVVIYQDADVSVLDAHGHTILGNANLAVELGYARARARGLSVTKIRHCHNRILIIGYLSRVARRGMNVTAFWRNAHTPLTEQVVGFRAGHTEPELCAYSIDTPPDDVEPNDGITLIMANHVDLLPGLRSDHPLTDLVQQSEHSLAALLDHSLHEGMDVEDALWRRLKKLADRLLVESSDASRHGAGASSSDID